MLSKDFWTKTKTLVFIILISFSLFSVAGIYLAMSSGIEREFTEYKKDYFTEQTHKMSNFISVNSTETLLSAERVKMYQNLSKEFSIPFEIHSEDSTYPYFTAGVIDTDDPKIFTVNVPIISNGNVNGYIKTFYDVDNQIISPAITKYENRIKGLLTFVSTILLGTLFIFSVMLARLLAKPVEKASKLVLKVIKGNRDIHIPRGGTTESRYLIDGINSVLVEFRNMENWRKQMMEDLTHELRTPLTSVLAIMEAMIDGIYPTNNKYLQDVYDEVDRLSRLLINVQNLSEAESARFKLNVIEVNLVNIIKSTYEGFLYIAHQKDIHFHFNYPNKPCLAEVDPDRFIQVITNLISNALKYTRPKGTVEIGIEFLENGIEFYCVDNGIGISEEDQLLVFNRFYRVEKSRSRQSGGSGIGLNVSEALVQAQGWDIGVVSILGEGSRFWVRIPTTK